MSFDLILKAVLIAILIYLSVQDIKKMEIPNWCSIAIAGLGIIRIIAAHEIKLLPAVIGAFCISLPMLIVALLVNGGFGGGDIKLMAAAGLFLGWRDILVAGFMGIVFGAVYAVILLITKKAKKNSQFPLGPFLAAGIAIAAFAGEYIISQYLSLFTLV